MNLGVSLVSHPIPAPGGRYIRSTSVSFNLIHDQSIETISTLYDILQVPAHALQSIERRTPYARSQLELEDMASGPMSMSTTYASWWDKLWPPSWTKCISERRAHEFKQSFSFTSSPYFIPPLFQLLHLRRPSTRSPSSMVSSPSSIFSLFEICV